MPRNVKARDLRANIKEHGFEQGVVMTLEWLLEEHSNNRINMRSMAQMLDQCIDEITKMVKIGNSLQQDMSQLKRDNEAQEN